MEVLAPLQHCDICDECGSELVEKVPNIICQNCGLIHETIFIETTPAVSIDKVLGQDFYTFQYTNKKWVFWGMTSSSYSSDHFLKQLAFLKQLCFYFELTRQTYLRARAIYLKFIKGERNHKALAYVAVAVLISSRENGYPLLIDEVIKYTQQAGHKLAFKDLRVVTEHHRKPIPLLDPKSCLGRVFNKLSSFGQVPLEMVYPYLDLYHNGFSTRHPFMFAIACVTLVYAEQHGFPKSRLFEPFPFNYHTLNDLVRELKAHKSKVLKLS